MGEVKEECGVAAVVIKKKSPLYEGEAAPYIIYNLISQLQHRGQTSSGIAIYSDSSSKKLRTCKEGGVVSNLFKVQNPYKFNKFLEENKGTVGIGHVRYATSNVGDDVEVIENEAQPFLRRHGRSWKRFALAFNGHLTNYSKLRKELITRQGYMLDTCVDTEILIHLIALFLSKHSIDGQKPNLFDVFRSVFKHLEGSFSFVFVNAEGEVIVARDEKGFRPLVIGQNENFVAVASESNALLKVGVDNFRDVDPGEIVLIKPSGELFSEKVDYTDPSHCHFEYVYFSNACSVNEGISVDQVRSNLGRELAKEEFMKERFSEEGWIVVPIPSTAIPAAIEYSSITGIPLSLALIKSDVGRGFINSDEQRKNIMDSKYNIIINRIAGKKIILIDDSIVRGETSGRIIQLLREKGKAKEVHFRVTESPIRFPCCYGVDFHSLKELVVGGLSGSKQDFSEFVSKKIGSDSMNYLSLNGLKNALGGGEEKFCFACLNGNYPTEDGKEFLQKALKEFKETILSGSN